MKPPRIAPAAAATIAALALLFAAPPAASEEAPGIFELRTYHAAEGKIDALHERFRRHTTRLLERHGIVNVGYWTPREDASGPLVFLLAFPDREARERSFEAFLADPEWQAAHAASSAGGTLVESMESVLLEPTDYSPPFPADAAGGPRTYELRRYTTRPGKADDLDARFRDHTVELFAKHGMENLFYFRPAEDQEGAGDLLVFLLAHESAEAREESFASFREDPDWVAARDASESEGPILVEGGVESTLLDATDYSPLP